MKIHTSFDYPPLPIRNMDYSAITDNYDGAPDAGFQPVGHGETREAAIADLLEQLSDEGARALNSSFVGAAR